MSPRAKPRRGGPRPFAGRPSMSPSGPATAIWRFRPPPELAARLESQQRKGESRSELLRRLLEAGISVHQEWALLLRMVLTAERDNRERADKQRDARVANEYRAGADAYEICADWLRRFESVGPPL